MRFRTGFAAAIMALAATIPMAAATAAQDEGVALTLLHNNDGESSLMTLAMAVGEDMTLEVGGIPAFASVTQREIADARAAGNSVLNVYAGDAFLASATLACSSPEDPSVSSVPHDAIAQAQMPYDVHVFGNHEFDYGPDFLQRFILGFADESGLDHPFLSANLDFSAEPGWQAWIDEDGLIETRVADGRIVARSAIVTDPETGERFGVVGATTERLPIISSPRDVVVAEAATAAQAEIDRLLQNGIDRIIFVSHLQGVDADQELVGQLSGVDIAVAGGGDELLVNDESQLLPGEDPEGVFGSYPLMATDADGREVPIVTTAGNYKYLGRVDVVFGADGEVVELVADTSYPRRVIPAEQAEEGIIETLGIADAVAGDAALVSSVLDPLQGCLDQLAATPVAISDVLLNVDRGQYDAANDVFDLGVRSAETNGGDLIADAFTAAYDRYATTSGLEPRGSENLVVSVQNGGGIRQNAGPILPVGGTPSDPITRLDTINVLPFDNTVVVVTDLSGEDLAATLQTSCQSRGGGGFLQVSGVSYTCQGSDPATSTVTDVVIDSGDGSAVTVVDSAGAVDASVGPIDLVTNSFTAAGGDGYEVLGGAASTRLVGDDGAQVYYERALREYLESFPATEDGVPRIPADSPYAAEGGAGRITLADG